jgi:hypothetical protein
MAIDADFSISSAGDIRYTGTTANYTVLELHQWLQDLADQAAASGNDILDITDLTPSSRSTDNIITLTNGFNIDDTAAQHLYDGSIIQTNGDEIYDGLVVIGNCAFVQIMQNGALISTANDFWNDNTPLGYNPDLANGISHRFMVKVRTGAADTDGRRLIGLTREFGNTYAEFSINGTARGNNVLALSEQDDLNNETVEGTVAAWTAFSNTEGYTLMDVVGDGSADEPYYSKWAIGAGTPAAAGVNDLYEWTKHASRRGSTSTLYGLVQTATAFRGVTHEIVTDTPVGSFLAFEAVSWTGGTAQMLAIDSQANPTKMWIQLLTGVAPTDGQTITGTGTCDVNVTVTERTPVPQPFIGQSTGSAIIGGYGVGVDDTDLSFPDKLIDLGNVLREAPNNVTFTVEGLAAGDSVLVARYDGVGDIDKGQYTLLTTLSGVAESTVVITGTIEPDTPQTGIAVRVVNDSGFDVHLPVASWTGSTFTLTTPYVFNGIEQNDAATQPKNVYVDYIDTETSGTTETFSVVYDQDRLLFIRVRDGAEPIKTFETTATLGSSGGTATAIRTADA